MYATAAAGPLAGLPDPDLDRHFYAGVPPAASWPGSSTSRSSSRRRAARRPLRPADPRLRLRALPLIMAAVGFLYRTATLAGGVGHPRHALHRHRVPPRRRRPLRLHDRAPAHRRSTPSASAVSCCSSVSCAHHPRHPLPPEHRRHHPRHHRDQPPGRLSPPSPRAFTRAPRILLPAAERCCYPSVQKGETPGPLMRHTLPQSHQFYVTAPQPCPYLAGKVERKLFTALQGDGARHLNDVLSHQGFRRSQNVLYRPSCAGCSACLSARIVVADFAPIAQPAPGARPQRAPRAGLAQPLGHRGAVPPVPPLPRRAPRHRRHGRHGHERVRGDDRGEPGPQPGDRILPPAPGRPPASSRRSA